jgi:alpha-glucosidase
VEEACHDGRRRRRTPDLAREALRRTTGAGAGFALLGPLVRWQGDLTVAEQSVELLAAPSSSAALRLSVLGGEVPADGPIPLDGALVDPTWSPTARLAVAESGETTVGDFSLRVLLDPLRIRIARPGGPVVQELSLDPRSGALGFDMGRGTLLGMGQGGPQFDRRGSTYRQWSGQGGY